MRKYDEIEVDTIEEMDMFLPGMNLLIGDDDAEWVVERIEPITPPWEVNKQPEHRAGFRIIVYRDQT